MIGVMITDDHLIVRQGLRCLIEATEDIKVNAEFASGFELKEALKNGLPDVAVMDLSMPGGGLELVKELRDTYANLPLLILSTHPEDQFAVRAFRAGASGYLSKECCGEQLIEAIRSVQRGDCFLTKKSAGLLAAQMSKKTKAIETHDMLSDREFAVLLSLGEGRSLTDVAKDFGLSIKTVSTYRTRVLKKMNMSNNAELVHYVLSHKLSSTLQNKFLFTNAEKTDEKDTPAS